MEQLIVNYSRDWMRIAFFVDAFECFLRTAHLLAIEVATIIDAKSSMFFFVQGASTMATYRVNGEWECRISDLNSGATERCPLLQPFDAKSSMF